MTVAVNPVSSALPYFIAVDRGYFKDAGIETEMKRIAVPTLAISGMVAGQIDAVAVILAIDGANANIKKPGVDHVHRAERAEHDLSHGAVRHPQGLRGEIARGPERARASPACRGWVT